MKRIKKKDLLQRIENLEEAVSTLMFEKFVRNLEALSDAKVAEKKGKKPKTKKEEPKKAPKKRGRKPKKEVK